MPLTVSLSLLVNMSTRLVRMTFYTVKTIVLLGTIILCVYGTNISSMHT
jgi:hypothetical protein